MSYVDATYGTPRQGCRIGGVEQVWRISEKTIMIRQSQKPPSGVQAQHRKLDDSQFPNGNERSYKSEPKESPKMKCIFALLPHCSDGIVRGSQSKQMSVSGTKALFLKIGWNHVEEKWSTRRLNLEEQWSTRRLNLASVMGDYKLAGGTFRIPWSSAWEVGRGATKSSTTMYNRFSFDGTNVMMRRNQFKCFQWNRRNLQRQQSTGGCRIR